MRYINNLLQATRVGGLHFYRLPLPRGRRLVFMWCISTPRPASVQDAALEN